MKIMVKDLLMNVSLLLNLHWVEENCRLLQYKKNHVVTIVLLCHLSVLTSVIMFSLLLWSQTPLIMLPCDTICVWGFPSQALTLCYKRYELLSLLCFLKTRLSLRFIWDCAAILGIVH